MKTFETMKHNIPEGATHYRDESDGFIFSWVMFDDGGALNVYTTALGWCRLNHSKFKDKVKPIPTIQTETQEEKEALDAIEKTYRYEKVELSPKEVFMAMLNGESFYVLKDELIDFDGEQFWRHTSEGKSRITYINHDHEIYRRIEVTERELFIDAYASAVNNHMKNVEDVAGKLFDAGCRFVNGKG